MTNHSIIARRDSIATLGALKQAGYRSYAVKEEMRANLIERLSGGQQVFHGIVGYDDSVLPDIERAILSRHNIILLGLRGQAKTRIARAMINLLDEYIPVVEGSEINDDPLHPLSRQARDIIAEAGDDTPIAWLHRSMRFSEKLATPDVTVADLIGDVDPIKAANLRLPYSDERVIHFGLVPRSHRAIFVINELPDLQARIQVALFNILQEGDIQIRGFNMRFPLDIQFVFTANPEDYTNRGSIVTPLKDRIDSQILTHYPRSIEDSRAITVQEADITPEQGAIVSVNDHAKNLIEHIAFAARESEYVDDKSGVSARLTISAYENLVSSVERRALRAGLERAQVRMSDLIGVIPSITGKIELVYEGEQEGAAKVAHILIGKAVRRLFTELFPDPEKNKRKSRSNIYADVVGWFAGDTALELPMDLAEDEYRARLESVAGLRALVERFHGDADELTQLFLMEFVLHGLAEFSVLSKQLVGVAGGSRFSDLLRSMFSYSDDGDEEGDDSDEDPDDEY